MGYSKFIKMKKIYLFLILGILFIGTFVVATDIDKIKIEKIKLADKTYEYYVYKLSEITTDKKLEEDKIKLEKRKIDLEKEQKEFDLTKDYFLKECLKNEAELREVKKKEIEQEVFIDCYFEQEYLKIYFENELIETEKKLNELEKIK